MLSETTRSDAVLKRLLTLHPKKIDLALDRILRLLSALGNPQAKLPPVIHVAGTNGKGSACAFARAMLEAQGLKVHVHTSPHLVRFHERIRIAGKLISEEALVSLLEEVEQVNAGSGDDGDPAGGPGSQGISGRRPCGHRGGEGRHHQEGFAAGGGTAG